MNRRIKQYFELIFWAGSLTLLAVMNPDVSNHYSFCILKMTGIDTCPGCGLGHSISYFFHGDFKASLSAHPFGILAIILIPSRIYTLVRLHF